METEKYLQIFKCLVEKQNPENVQQILNWIDSIE